MTDEIVISFNSCTLDVLCILCMSYNGEQKEDLRRLTDFGLLICLFKKNKDII